MLVKFNSVRLLGFKDRMIIPGINDLDEDFVADMMDDPILADKFDRAELEIIDRREIGAVKVKAKGGGEPSAVEILLAASDRNAKELAGKTVGMEILREWLSKEKRGPVKRAIKDQIEKITNITYRDEGAKKPKLERSKDED